MPDKYRWSVPRNTDRRSTHSPGGSIINIGSCLGSRVPTAGFSSYATSKAAITGFTRGLARDMATRGFGSMRLLPAQLTLI
ncbi:SDR family NAD(P)-dependent oxidoreductase [Klebsiella pneumoniae]|nr:SDR family NAD(P)-dependent oxidoreductase [Klebsiella pneumoniae]